ncbi:MAG TPA: TlpA disulfide reductase family protein [Gaiellaceae bacterium]|nr:TlpA disulfide reductase family protein [Gaiellaceae bacterium]
MSDRVRRRPWGRTPIAFLLVLALAAACGGDSSGDASAGGASDLPGPVPAGVGFREAPAGAAPAPALSARLVDGSPVAGSDLWEDRPVVLVFTASWCERCRDVHRRAADVVDEHAGVALLGLVTEDDAEPARGYADELDLGHPIAVADDGVWLSYAVREPPAVVLVGPGGKVLRGWPGGVEASVLAARLEELVEDSGDAGG